MIIKNKTNGKEVPVTKERWDSFSRIVKANFTVVDKNDSDDQEQIVKSFKSKVPDTGNKLDVATKAFAAYVKKELSVGAIKKYFDDNGIKYKKTSITELTKVLSYTFEFDKERLNEAFNIAK